MCFETQQNSTAQIHYHNVQNPFSKYVLKKTKLNAFHHHPLHSHLLHLWSIWPLEEGYVAHVLGFCLWESGLAKS